ncbi:MAG: hypothetical protein ABI760_18910 [Ferruginibacter sp.]
MKVVSTFAASIKGFRIAFLTAGLITILFTPCVLFAQTDSTEKAAPAAKNDSSLISPSIEFLSTQKANDTIDLKAALKAKVKGTIFRLPLLKVSFIQVTDSGEKLLGFGITDQAGKAVFQAKAGSLATDKEGKFHFKAVFAGNKAMDPVEEELTIKRARLEITPAKEDSLLNVKVKLIDVGTGTEIPVPKATLGIFVTRMFNPLKVGEGTTDENGEATIEIPANLPGDTKGNINLVVKLEENELYGNLEAGVCQQWGTSVSDKSNELPRALWSPHPPLWMIVTFVILMMAVWGHYIVIIYKLFRLRKEEPPVPTNATNSYL